MDLVKYDVILGITFLQDHNPMINWKEFNITFRNDNLNRQEDSIYENNNDTVNGDWIHHQEDSYKNDIVEINDQNNEEIHLLDYRYMKKSLQKYENKHSIAVVNNVENNQSLQRLPEGIDKLINKFSDIFPHELTARLPPKRNIEHGIEIESFLTNSPGDSYGEQLGRINLLSNKLLSCFFNSSCSINDNLYGGRLGGVDPDSISIPCSIFLFGGSFAGNSSGKISLNLLINLSIPSGN